MPDIKKERTYKNIRNPRIFFYVPLSPLRDGLTLSRPGALTVSAAQAQTFKLRLMEQLNRIEIRGNVGAVRLQVVGNSRVARISVATNYVYKGRDGEPVIETTWHYVSAWEGKNIPDLTTIHKGDKVYVVGRLRSQRYTAADGTERTTYDVLASKLQIIESDEFLQYEF